MEQEVRQREQRQEVAAGEAEGASRQRQFDGVFLAAVQLLALQGLDEGDGLGDAFLQFRPGGLGVGEAGRRDAGQARGAALGRVAGELDLAGEGKISFRDVFSDSLADLYLRFRFSDSYKTKNEITKSLFGAPGSNMPALFELADPRIKNAKRADGFYGWHMVGQLKDPRFEASASGGGGGSHR